MNPCALDPALPEARIWIHGQRVVHEARCLELADGGCALATHLPIESGTSVRLCVEVRGREVRMLGTVARVSTRGARHTVEVRFDGVAAGDRAHFAVHASVEPAPSSTHPLLAFGRPARPVVRPSASR